MTRHHAYLTQTQQWIDVLTERAATLVRLSPALRLQYARAELAEQVRNHRIETARHQRATPEMAPRHARRIREIEADIAVLRRFVGLATEWMGS